MNSRAELVYHYLLEALIGGIVIYLLVVAGKQLTSGELIEKRFHTVNIAELISTVGAVPYAATITYPYMLDKHHLSLDRRESKFIIGMDDPLPLYSSVQEWRFSQLKPVVLKNPKELYIIKDESSISLSQKKPEWSAVQPCPAFAGEARGIVVIAQDPSLKAEMERAGAAFVQGVSLDTNAPADKLYILLKSSANADVVIQYTYGDTFAEAIACRLRNALSAKKRYLVPAKLSPGAVIAESVSFSAKDLAKAMKGVK